jgi:hypothetical protein
MFYENCGYRFNEWGVRECGGLSAGVPADVDRVACAYYGGCTSGCGCGADVEIS